MTKSQKPAKINGFSRWLKRMVSNIKYKISSLDDYEYECEECGEKFKYPGVATTSNCFFEYTAVCPECGSEYFK